MFTKKEVAMILAGILIVAFSLDLFNSLQNFAYVFASMFFIVVSNVLAKKVSAFYLDSEIESGLWEIHYLGLAGAISRGFHPSRKLKKPFMMGAFLPILTSFFSFGYFVWMAPLVFEVKAKVHRAAKRFGLYSFSEMSEWHIGLIAASGIAANLVLGIIGYLIGYSLFSQLNIFYAFFNMIPISDLDGNKIFFGSLELWSFLAALVALGLGFIFLVL